MKTRAAVAVASGKPLEVMEVNLVGPRAGEVLVEIRTTGLCHTDEFTRSGDDPEGIFPAILGHEGAGVVIDVGEGVTSLEVGDHVIPLYTPECRECDYCLNPKTNLCQSIRSTQGQVLLPDGSTRFSMLDGTPIHHYMGCSTFANHTVVPEIALAKVRKDAPFDKICYIGSGTIPRRVQPDKALALINRIERTAILRKTDSLWVIRTSKLLQKLANYISINRSSVVDYGTRCRAGQRIATSTAEASVNALVAKRFVKWQQMRWSRRGAHYLLKVRAAVINGDLSERQKYQPAVLTPQQPFLTAA